MWGISSLTSYSLDRAYLRMDGGKTTLSSSAYQSPKIMAGKCRNKLPASVQVVFPPFGLFRFLDIRILTCLSEQHI